MNGSNDVNIPTVNSFIMQQNIPYAQTLPQQRVVQPDTALTPSHLGRAEYEIAQERASALGRLGRRLDAALTALAACPRTAGSNRNTRESLVEEAGYALWLLAVQREACGLNKIDYAIQVYGVPNEVVARMGPLAMPSIHPTKTVGG